ncbi:ATP-binding protein [Synoicihabitans lomoniglobus]|uniref:ATP-binding protein n=1 Tax=Synoicihabitans lomoniglobus TaxID=2909285 RepID=UPI002ED1C909|nr:ATP-binding protein [Opitutaceae bacterium LMO-M01]
MLPSAAHEKLKSLLTRSELFDLDPQTQLPRNHDLQQASRDAFRGAALALTWELAGRVQSEKPWLKSLGEALGAGKLRQLFSDDAIAGDPRRAWVMRLQAAISTQSFLDCHDKLQLNDAEIRSVLGQGRSSLSDRLTSGVSEWVDREVGSDGQPPEFQTLLHDGWQMSPEAPVLRFVDLHASFFAEYLKHRPEVSRIHVAQELADLRQSLDDEFSDLRGSFAAIDDQLGQLLRQQSQLALDIGEVMATLATLNSARAHGDEQQRALTAEILHGVLRLESKFDYLLGGLSSQTIDTLRLGDKRKHPQDDRYFMLPQYRALPLVGRDADLADLRDWLRAPDALSVRLMIGRAGSGKTRLAFEFLAELGDQWAHWTAGWMTRDHLATTLQRDPAKLHWDRPALLVIDYAQALADPITALLQRLRDNAPESGPPLRVLLLERVEGAWFDTMLRTDEVSSYAASSVGELFDPPSAVKVQPLPPGRLRRDLLASALTRVAQFHGKPSPPLPTEGDDASLDHALAKTDFAEPLLLILAARTALDEGLTAAMAHTRTELAHLAAKRERARLRRYASLSSSTEQRSAERLLCHLAACATLEEVKTTAELNRLVQEELAALGLPWPSGWGDLAQQLQEILPGQTMSETSRVVGPILPDFVGEAFVLQQLAVSEKSATPWHAWESVVRRGAQRDPVGLPKNIIHAWQNFGQDYGTSEAERPLLYATDMLIADAAVSRDRSALLGLLGAMPDQSLELADRALKLAKLNYERARNLAEKSESPDLSDWAHAASNWANRLSGVGRREEALVAAEEAVGLRRQLVERNRDAYLPDLASSVNNWANRLSGVGRREEALVAAEEAVGLYRQLVERNRDAYLPNLAMSVNNWAAYLSGVGRREEALVAAEEAVGLRRQLVERNRDAYLPNLAMSLAVLGDRQFELEHFAEAAHCHKEALFCLAPAFRRLPQAHGNLFIGIARDYFSAIEKAGAEPENDVVELLRELGLLVEGQPDGGKPESPE